MQSIYRLLTLNKNAAISTYNRLLRIKGLDCIVRPPVREVQPFRQYEPGQFGSIFGLEDKVEHSTDDAYPKRLLIFNLMREGYAGGNDFDTFNTEAFCLTKANEILPKGTDIEIDFYGRKMWMKVDDHKNLTPHITEQLFIKNILVPAT